MSKGKKVAHLRELAKKFRERALETNMSDYIELMTRAANELEDYANRLETGAATEG